jgi:hypothetical protein
MRFKMKKYILLLIILATTHHIKAGELLINEVVTGTSSDWVEIKLKSNTPEKMEISNLFITMYYGSNEKLSETPVTIYSYNRSETPYDDRYILIHLTNPEIQDETDLTGDTNHNGYIDIYCNNYSNSLWNSDGIVSIDTDDDPSNGGIIDFIAYSNLDDSENTTISSYVNYVINFNQWIEGITREKTYINITSKGLATYMSLSRKEINDSNSLNDFAITNFQTPGRENIFSLPSGRKKIFTILSKRISAITGRKSSDNINIPLSIYENCNLKLRIFSVRGRLLYQSDTYKSVKPGKFILKWNKNYSGRSISPTGLYIGQIEAVSSAKKMSEKKSLYIILSKYNNR